MRFVLMLLGSWIVAALTTVLVFIVMYRASVRRENHRRAIRRRRSRWTSHRLDALRCLRWNRRRAWRKHDRVTKALLGSLCLDGVCFESGYSVHVLLICITGVILACWWRTGRQHQDISHYTDEVRTKGLRR